MSVQGLLTDWLIFSLDIDVLISTGWPQVRWMDVPSESKSEGGRGPAVYSGTLQPNGLAWDTFLKLTGWTKVRLVHLQQFSSAHSAHHSLAPPIQPTAV